MFGVETAHEPVVACFEKSSTTADIKASVIDFSAENSKDNGGGILRLREALDVPGLGWASASQQKVSVENESVHIYGIVK